MSSYNECQMLKKMIDNHKAMLNASNIDTDRQLKLIDEKNKFEKFYKNNCMFFQTFHFFGY